MKTVMSVVWIMVALVITVTVLPKDMEVRAWDNQYGFSPGIYWDWAGGTIEWYVNNDFDSDLVSNAKLEGSIAANHWDDGNISGSSLDFEEGSLYSSSDVKIVAFSIDDSWSGGRAQCTVDVFIEACTATIDKTGWNWYTDGVTSGRDYTLSGSDRDVFSVVAHEVGHSVGFAHKFYNSSISSLKCDANTTTGEGEIQINSIMCSGENVVKTALNSEDKVGVTDNYN